MAARQPPRAFRQRLSEIGRAGGLKSWSFFVPAVIPCELMPRIPEPNLRRRWMAGHASRLLPIKSCSGAGAYFAAAPRSGRRR